MSDISEYRSGHGRCKTRHSDHESGGVHLALIHSLPPVRRDQCTAQSDRCAANTFSSAGCRLSEIMREIAVALYRLTEDGQLAGVTADNLKRKERHAAGKRHNPRNDYSHGESDRTILETNMMPKMINTTPPSFFTKSKGPSAVFAAMINLLRRWMFRSAPQSAPTSRYLPS
jgi:hypothetical protein